MGKTRDVSTRARFTTPWEMTFWLPQAEAVLAQVEGRSSVCSIGVGWLCRDSGGKNQHVIVFL